MQKKLMFLAVAAALSVASFAAPAADPCVSGRCKADGFPSQFGRVDLKDNEGLHAPKQVLSGSGQPVKTGSGGFLVNDGRGATQGGGDGSAAGSSK